MRHLHWFSLLLVSMAFASVIGESEENPSEELEEEHEAHYAILYPWFVQALGIFVFYLSTRLAKLIPFPYTAIMFLLGTLMGIGYEVSGDVKEDQLSISIGMWENINSEVLLLTFLPGLIFYDAFSLNVHLFQKSCVQTLIMAFPMVLMGTMLIGLVAYYIFPYGWSLNLAITFGAILSATDPVAVNALLSEVGAPERLKMHISGESLLNDGSAIVFFGIFSDLFLKELGVDGLGDEVTFTEGVIKFVTMAFGGAGIGIAFGLGLVSLLFILNKKLLPDENIVQVASTVTVAYLCYYVADSVLHTSGVLAVVFCGVTTKALGTSLINDMELMNNFWELVEHLLNTLLFAIGGTVWGTIISNVHPREFTGTDWGYLILLYILATVIRFGLVFLFYPLIARIGLKSSVNEAVFISYGGLRGAVGIALAVYLDNIVHRNTDDELSEFRMETTKLFGMTGGIAFLTLFINGSTAGAVLNYLGLTKQSEAYEMISEAHYDTLKMKLLDGFIHYLSYPLFDNIDFGIVQRYVPYMADFDLETLEKAVLKNKRGIPPEDYQAPNLDSVLQQLMKSENDKDVDLSWYYNLREPNNKKMHGLSLIGEGFNEEGFEALQAEHNEKPETKEYRLVFLEVLRATYARYVELGYLNRHGFVFYSLEQGLDFAADAANEGKPLRDWEASHIVNQPIENFTTYLFTRVFSPFKKGMNATKLSEQRFLLDLNRAVTFIRCHEKARDIFQQEFGKEGMKGCMDCVLQESLRETRIAADKLRSYDDNKVKVVMSQICCILLLSRASKQVESLSKKGLLKEQEATEKLEEIDGLILHVGQSSEDFESEKPLRQHSLSILDHGEGQQLSKHSKSDRSLDVER
eukprot:CAMPEP_0178938992 /NCGR_PEP_ID=MMETSP0786-20121207/26636_1 /TAXON_ID=186022 /ORGANISM="Thalassionema frauenfeldii, Strain CCMP 1798" /LENGTH=861 /DNA_ID=CAMNT_0020617767 /DNA_START=145 /DNA_END=2730 /DNA_ORIENTATION=-